MATELKDKNNDLILLNKSINKMQESFDKISVISSINALQKAMQGINDNTFNSLNKMVEGINSYNNLIAKYAALSSVNYLTDYVNEYNKIYKTAINASLKKIDNFKYQEYITLSTNILKEQLERINAISKRFDFSKSHLTEENLIQDNIILTPQIKAIPKFLSYAYSNTSKVSLEEAYDKSKLNDIREVGKKIIDTIIGIDDLYFFKTKKRIHGDSIRDHIKIAVNITEVANDELEFKNLITMLYKGIFEYTCDGKINNLYTLADEFHINHFGFDLIKWFRALDEHAHDRTDKKKIKKVYSFNERVINKKISEKPSDFKDLQRAIYIEIFNFLNEIFEKLNTDNINK